jgi:hypothetical protein
MSKSKVKATTIVWTPLSLDLARDFCLFPKLKNALKGTHLQSVDEMKLKTLDLLNRVSADDLQNCSEQWEIHMQCIDWAWEYAEGDKLIYQDSENKPNFSHQSHYFIAIPCMLVLQIFYFYL